MANFIVQFPLKTEKYQEDILDKRFEIGRQIYNSLVNVTQKRYKEMIKTTKYRNLMSKLSGDKKKDKLIWKEISEIRKQYGMSEYSFHADVKKMWYRLSRREDDYCIECSADGIKFSQMRVCHLHEGGNQIRFGVYACSPEESSFKAIFKNMQLTKCQWLAHDGQQPD